MRNFIGSERHAREHADFLARKVAAARLSVALGQGRGNDVVEAEFAARRASVKVTPK
jgi:hypothetical protein